MRPHAAWAIVCLFALVPAPNCAQDDDFDTLERRAKTALLYRFISRSEAAQLPAARRAGGHALLVTEWPGARAQGGVINFRKVEGQMRFEISLEAAQQRLRISSRLLPDAHNAPELKP